MLFGGSMKMQLFMKAWCAFMHKTWHCNKRLFYAHLKGKKEWTHDCCLKKEGRNLQLVKRSEICKAIKKSSKIMVCCGCHIETGVEVLVAKNVMLDVLDIVRRRQFTPSKIVYAVDDGYAKIFSTPQQIFVRNQKSIRRSLAFKRILNGKAFLLIIVNWGELNWCKYTKNYFKFYIFTSTHSNCLLL